MNYGYCVSARHEALTRRNGWKKREQLKVGEEIATWNKGKFEWQPIEQLSDFWYDGDLEVLDHRRARMEMTPNHRVLGKFRSSGHYILDEQPWEIRRADEASSAYEGQVPVAADWDGEEVNEIMNYPAESFMRLFGYYVSEGWITHNQVHIGQSEEANPEVVDDIESTIRSLGLLFKYNGTSFTISNKELAREFEKSGGSGALNKKCEYKYLSRNLLKQFLDGYLNGDGWIAGKGYQCETVSKQLSDDLIEIGIKCGWIVRYMGKRKRSANHNITYRQSFSRGAICYHRRNWKLEHYEGVVWCPTVKNSIWLTRADGKVCWTGNTSELHHRMWDEMTPVPTEPASLRLIVTYAGYEPGSTGRSEEKNLLWDLYTKNVGPEEYKDGKGTLVHELFPYPVYERKRVFTCWFHEPTMPWQDEEYYEDEKDELRTGAYIRLHDNRFASSSEQFVDMDWWDKSLVLKGPLLPTRTRAISVGVDFAPKHNCAAAVGTYFDWETKKVRQAFHKIWSPKPKEPLDPAIVENWLLSVFVKFRVYYIGYDPYQFHGSGVRLAAMGLPMQEVTQTDAHMIPATEELYGLLKYDRFETYDDAQCREHVSAAVAEDRGKGARLSKVKSGAKNDYTIALAISALESVNSGGIPLEDEVIIESPFADTSEWPVDYDRWKQEQALPFELRSADDETYYGE